MATLRNRRKLAAFSVETPENTKNNQSQNTLNPGMAQEYISRVSEKIEGSVTKKLSKKFSRTELRILGALSKLDEVLPNPQVRTCSVSVPGISRNNDSENREPTGDGSLGDPCPKAVFSAFHSSNLNDSDQEETHHIYLSKMDFTNVLFLSLWQKVHQMAFSIVFSHKIGRNFSFHALMYCFPSVCQVQLLIIRTNYHNLTKVTHSFPCCDHTIS